MAPIESIYEFLTSNGFDCRIAEEDGMGLIIIRLKDGRERAVLPVEISSTVLEEAVQQSSHLKSIIMKLGEFPLIITEDRWNNRRSTMQSRLLAHLETFFPIYARNCEIRKIDKAAAAEFLGANHSYGDASCRYRYGMFLKRNTGWRSFADAQYYGMNDAGKIPTPGTLVAVAEFSNARKWTKGDKTVKSYEWTRYASLSGVRINGGMGKMLKHFINEVHPDDIMSYADLEWSEGSVYEQLGFILEGQKDPVSFKIDRNTWERKAVRISEEQYIAEVQDEAIRYFCNFGSNKYRLKLTDYQ